MDSSNHLQKRELFFTNLLLLGFDVASMEKKHGITFDQEMFQLPNKKAFEVVTHFLITKLNDVVKEEYKITWPILDKTQEHEFRKACYNHLLQISKEDANGVRFPRINQSIFLAPGGAGINGDRFYELYMAFSSYVLHKTIVKDKVCHPLYRPTVTAQNYKDVKETLQLATIISTRKFVELLKIGVECQRKWHETNESLVLFYRKIKQGILEKQKLNDDELHSLVSMSSTTASRSGKLSDDELRTSVEASGNSLNEVLCKWNELENDMSKDQQLWDVVKTELDAENTEKPILDGKKYMIPIPQVLKTEYQKELQEREVQSLIVDSKLCIKSFLNLCYVTLKYYKEILEKVGLPDSEGLEVEFRKNCEKLESHLCLAGSLREKLSTLISDVVSEKTELERTSYTQESFANSEVPSLQCSSLTHSSSAIPEDKQNDSVLPKNVLELTSYAVQKEYTLRKKKLQHRTLRLHASEMSQKSATISAVPKPSDSLSSVISEKSKESQIPILSIHQPHKQYSILNSRNSRNVLQSKPSVSNFHNPVVSHQVEELKNHVKNIDTANCRDGIDWDFSDINKNCDINYASEETSGSTFQKVQMDFIKQVINKASVEDSNISPCGETFFNMKNINESPDDFLGEKAFHLRDKVPRTPVCKASESAASITKLEQQSQVHIGELSDTFFAFGPRGSNRESWSEEELLDNVTLPEFPI